MEPLDALLAYLFWCSPEQYGDEAFTGGLLCDDLNASSASASIVYVQPPDLSLLRQGRPISEAKKTAIAQLLRGSANEEKRAQIAEKLGFPELFTFNAQEELISAFRRKFEERLSNSVCEVESTASRSADFIGTEKRTVDEISNRLAYSKYPVLSWKHRFDVGAAQILSKLGSAEGFSARYDFVAHLWPDNLNNPFQAELLELCTKVSAGNKIPTSPAQIVSLLKEKRVLAIFHLIEILELERSGSNPVIDLLKELLKEAKKVDPDRLPNSETQETPVVLLSGTRSFFEIFGAEKSIEVLRQNEEQISEKINSALVNPSSGAEQYAGDLREALRALAGKSAFADLEEAGPLLRRAEQSSGESRVVEGAPIHQRIRALSIARHDNCSSFLDPTSGFRKLVGGDFSGDQDVFLFHREVARHVDYLWERDRRTETKTTRGKRKGHDGRNTKVIKKFPEAPHLETILKVSTGLHWLSRNAFEALSELRILTHGIDYSSRDAVPPVISNTSWVHVENHETGGTTARYFCSLGAKAILQDSWVKNSPRTRGAAHFIIAKYLDSVEDDKTRLPEEYPYAPHWGRSRIHFLGEKIRFLIRALADADPRDAVSDTLGKSFPSMLDLNVPQLSSAEVINYCYKTIFRQEMNGNRPNDKKRNLSKRHGAFRYAVELLSLLSGDEEIGIPHSSLAEELRGEFIRECGLALLDIGLTEKAGECFSRLEEKSWAKYQAASDGPDPTKVDHVLLEYLDSLLISSLFHNSVGDAAAAWAKASRAEEFLKEWHANRGHLNKNDGGPDWRTFQRFQSRRRQVELRRAQKEYLGTDQPDCVAVLGILRGLEVREADQRDLLKADAQLRRLISKNLPRSDMGFLDEAPFAEKSSRDTEARDDRAVLVPRRGPLDADMLHFKIAALGRMRREEGEASDGLVGALRVCLQALLRASSDGMHHDAMGLRISLAGIYRRLETRDIAEAVMDEVHGDLLKFGASERTYLAFLAESGRILVETKRQIHGYVSYLRPCIVRASMRGFKRDAERAARTAIPVLEDCLNMARAGEEDEAAAIVWQNQLASALLDYTQLERSTSSSFDDSHNDRLGGPLFAYSVPDVQQRIIEMSAFHSIEAELAFCRSHLGIER